MRFPLFIAIYLLCSSCGVSQSPTPTKYSEGFCDCLDSLNKPGGVHQNFPVCYSLALEKKTSAVEQELKDKYGDNSEKSMTLLNNDIMLRISLDLIDSCTIFFAYTDSLQQQQYKNLNIDSLHILLTQLNNYDISKRDVKYYQNIATLYFQSGDYKNALENVEHTLSTDPNNASVLFIKASILEKNRNYSEAIALYDKVVAITQNKSFLIYSQVAKRKKNGIPER